MVGTGWTWALLAAYAGAAAVGCFFARRIYYEWSDERRPPPGTIHMYDGYEGEAPFPVEIGRTIDPEEDAATSALRKRLLTSENGSDVA